MRDYKTPGVYVEELSLLPGSVAGVSTAIPAFVGYTEKAGVNKELYGKPTRVGTLKEYEDLFGIRTEKITVDATGDAITVTIGSEIAEAAIPPEAGAATKPIPVSVSLLNMYYSMQMFFNNGGERCYIVAMDPATSGTEPTNFQDAIDSLKLEDEPTLLVVVDAVSIGDVSYYSDVCKRLLDQCGEMKDRFAIIDVKQTESDSSADDDMGALRENIGTANLKYGAAYYPYLITTLKYRYTETSVQVIYKTGKDDTLKYHVAKLGDDPIKVDQTKLYNNIIDEIKKFNLILPPGAAVAGAYASVDRDRGVWKAPANIGLASVAGPAKKINEADNDKLNVDPTTGKSINAIRSFTGKGTLVWGARTLAGNDNEWRYVPVRRLFNYVEESIQKATAFSVFEPNNAMTWLKLRTMIESFLDGLWRQGALAGGKSEDSFFVQVGLGTTMTSQDILEGRLIIKVGLAAVRPAEFIVLEFTHKLQQS